MRELHGRAGAKAPAPPGVRRVLRACVAVGSVGFVTLAMVAHQVPYFSWDLTLMRAVQQLHGPWLERPLDFVSTIGFPPLVDVVYGAIAVILFAVGMRREAVAVGFTATGSAALNFAVKALVARPRPPDTLVHVAHRIDNSTFPAGHVLNATAYLGFLCYVACVVMAPSWRRTSILAFLVLVMIAMGVSRVYFGEHWPSDVLGGYLLGLLWLYVGVAFYRRIQPRRLERFPVHGAPRPSAPSAAVARRVRAS